MIRGVLFDLDGTVLHSAPDLVGALNQLRARHELQELSVAEMQQHAARGAIGLLQAGMPPADPDTLEQWRTEFIALYQERSYSGSNLFDGIAEVLEYLGSIGIPWGIVTNKPEFLTIPILVSAGLDSGLSCLVCGDTLEQKKPDPAPVVLACRQMCVEPDQTLFVGDDIRDMEAGIAAGTQTCAALYGYGSRELLKPEHQGLLRNGITIDRPEDLLHWLWRDQERNAQT